jgi:hypothetical protein
LAYTRVGTSTTSYNSFQITAGSSLAATNTNNNTMMTIGNGIDSGNNSLLVTGAGSSLTATAAPATFSLGFRLGYASSNNNNITIENGATASIGSGINIGGGAVGTGGSSNSIVINNATATFNGTTYLGDFGSNNSITVSNGGVLTTVIRVSGGTSSTGTGNNITVTGAGSKWVATTANTLVGSATSGGNTLTAANDGMIQLVSSANTSSAVLTMGTAGNNFVQLAGGYLAILGNRTGGGGANNYYNTMITQFQVWNGSAWETGVLGTNFTRTYYAGTVDGEALALAATGYSGLGNYTIFAGGTAIPEPTSIAMLGVAGLALLRRRRLN